MTREIGYRACRGAALTLLLFGPLGLAAIAARPSAAAEEPASSPDRRFDAKRRLFVSAAIPAFRLPIPEGLDYLGRIEFPLKAKAWVDRHLFARLDGQRIDQLVVIQFEGLLDGVEGSYSFGIPPAAEIAGSNYRFSPTRVDLGGHGWVHNTWAFDHEASAVEGPGLEADRTARYLESQGLELDGELIMSRFVREVGSASRDELILFYMLPLATVGSTLADLPEDGPPTQAYDRISEQVTRESLELFGRLESHD